VVQPNVATQVGDRPATSSKALLRLEKFTELFNIHFSGAPTEDPHDYLDHCHEVLRNMSIVETNRVDFAVFRMTGSAKTWWRDYMLTRPAGSPALTGSVLTTISGEIHPCHSERGLSKQFERLQQGSMTVTQYET